MDLINNLWLRESGIAHSTTIDFVIPRITSDNDDVYKKMGITDGTGDTVYYGEFLVGRFCPYYIHSDLFALTDEDGFVTIQDTSIKGEKSIKCNFRAHTNAIFDLTWMKSYSGALNIITGAGDSTVAMWDAETRKRVCVITSHNQCIRTVSAHRDIPGLLVIGARDGNISVHDHRCEIKYPVSIIREAHTIPDKRKNLVKKGGFSNKISVTSLVLKDENYLISGGFTDGLVKVWDLRRTYIASANKQPSPVYSLPVGGTVTSLVLQPRSSLLFASCKNNAIYGFDAINFNEKPVCKFVGHSTSSKLSSYLQCGVSPCGSYLACGSSGDNFVHIWATKQAQSANCKDSKDENEVPCVMPVGTLVEGHTDGVHCTQWCPRPGEIKLASLSDDNTHRIWRIGSFLDSPESGVVGQQNKENPRNDRVGNVGYTVMTQPSFFASQVKPTRQNSVIPVDSTMEISELPSFVHNPESMLHKCSPRAPKLRTNWLTALSPQNIISKSPSPGKVIKVPRPAKRKSSKKLHLLSPHFKTLLKPQATKY